MQPSAFDRLFNIFNPIYQEQEQIPQAALPPANSKKRQIPKTSKPIPIPSAQTTHTRVQDQNSLEELNSKVASLSLTKIETGYIDYLTKKITDFGHDFHKLKNEEIDSLADLIVLKALGNNKQTKTEKKDKQHPRTIYFDFEKNFAVIQLKTKGNLPEYRSDTLRTTRALFVSWKTNSENKPIAFDVHKVFQHATVDTLPPQAASRFVPLESRVNPKDSWFYPAYFGRYHYPKNEKIEKYCHITEAYEFSLQELVKKHILTTEELVTVVADTLEHLNSLHKIGVIHGNLGPNTIFIDSKGSLKLAGYECAVITSMNDRWKRNTYGNPKYTAPELRALKQIKPANLTKVDIYACGRMIEELITELGERDQHTKFLLELTRFMTTEDPGQRISANTALGILYDSYRRCE